jgi:hypothetical protein
MRKRRRQKKFTSKIAAVAVIVVIITLSAAIFAYIHFATRTVAIQTGPTTVSVDPTSTILQTAKIGQVIQVNINVTNAHNLWGWQLNNLAFNPDVLNLTQVLEGPFLKTGGPTFFLTTLNDTNWLQKGLVASTNEALNVNATTSGSGIILTLKFVVIAAGTSPIIINGPNGIYENSSLGLYDNYEIEPIPGTVTGDFQPINCTVTNGQITIDNIAS